MHYVCLIFPKKPNGFFSRKITAGHARAILSVQTPANRLKLTEKLKTKDFSTRG
ncbi:MAG: hypothetical protein ACLT98_11355 [Eggerthellaceae bacterium]